MIPVSIVYRRATWGFATTTTRSFTSKPHDSLSQPVMEDMIGMPDPVSNLRPVKYFVSSSETTEEREWRLLQQNVDEFNQTFWTDNNALFTQAKHDYEEQLMADGKEVSAEALSIFYKDFLNKAYDRQMEYNREWWKKNVSMLYPGFKAAVRQFKKPRVETTTRETGFWDKSFDS